MPVTAGYLPSHDVPPFPHVNPDEPVILQSELSLNECAGCSAVASLDTEICETIWPCLLRTRRRYSHTEGFLPHEFTLHAVFNLCDECYSYCDILLKVSDYLVAGKDWWDMLDTLGPLMTHCRQQMFDWSECKAVRETAKAMAFIQTAIVHQPADEPHQPADNNSNNTTPPKTQLTDLPEDVLTIIAPHLLNAHMDESARTIQRKWRTFVKQQQQQNKAQHPKGQ